MLKHLIGGEQMEYLTVKEIGERWGVTARMINYYCSTGRISGAIKKGNLWLVPKDAKKPIDGRTKSGKYGGDISCLNKE